MKIHKNFLKYIHILLISLASICISSCQKSPINGFLDGQWQVMNVEPAPESSSSEFDTSLYYCFYLHVCQLSIPGEVWISGNMSFDNDSLFIFFPKELSDTEKKALLQYGITSNPITFSVEEIKSNWIMLKSNGSTVTLRKF